MAKEKMTEKEIDREIAKLKADPEVALGRKAFRKPIDPKMKELYALRSLKNKGAKVARELESAGS